VDLCKCKKGEGEEDEMGVPSLCLRYFYNGGVVPRSVTKESLSSLLLTLPSSSRRYCCSNQACATTEQPCLRSTDLVALEYADLNLTHKVSEVSFFFFFFLL
jgi:hypothetical protein